ncbi:AB-hydrolase-associated lipase region [Neofusicoccum parvum]|uniref:AB-hydrolase-associated lipase region n=1 Tax=Neofusicoccum parvum TaxID=310453 RepID=A0ACB5S2G7_9PEZI|nr:AB-hydrolase-associated lipase region [Neofusicoccum parvum]
MTMASKTSHAKEKVKETVRSKAEPAIEFAHQSQRLGQYTPDQEDAQTGSTQAVEARFITPQDPVIHTANGGRLPAVPVEEAVKLNKLKDVLEDRDPVESMPVEGRTREAKDGTVHGARPSRASIDSRQSEKADAPLREAVPVSKTNPLFPPLPVYGPPGLMRDLQCFAFRVSAAILSFGFLWVIMMGSLFTSIPLLMKYIWRILTFRDPNKYRPFYEEEKRRKAARREADAAWKKHKKHDQAIDRGFPDKEDTPGENEEFVPTEGGPDPLVCDVGYYARRVGLDCETFNVQTEDGFIIELWHIYNPREYRPASTPVRAPHSPNVFQHDGKSDADGYPFGKKRKYPVLLMHGLLQSSGAFCSNDDDSLAFFLAKSGYDVWLGNNRCGFKPKHNLLKYSDPRMWAWNIRQMGVMDLPALVSRVLYETGFEKLALIAHSQGTTETFVALAKEQRPELGDKISVFCALAPAAYAGPLIGKMYFKFMRIISPAMFRIFFGIHAFIPFMMHMHKVLPGKFYGAMGYRIFSFLFNWTDERWEKDLRNRLFQFAPVYVSSESMRWWLGRECFASQKCILQTRREKEMEEKEDRKEEQDQRMRDYYSQDPRRGEHATERARSADSTTSCSDDSAAGADADAPASRGPHGDRDRGRYAWYDAHAPPMAFWVAGSDDLVDGRRLLRRFERGREPFVDVVHSKVIDGYEHLDVIWAMDMVDKVGKEVREVIWRTAPDAARRACRVPTSCERVEAFQKRGGRVELGAGAVHDHRADVGVDASTGERREDVKRADATDRQVATA